LIGHEPYARLVLFLGLFVVAVSLIVRLSRHYRAKGSLLDAKPVCVYVVLSFVAVGMFMAFAALAPPGQAVGPRGKELSPDIFAIVPAAMFFTVSSVAAIGLMLAAAFQFASSWFRPSRDAHAIERGAARAL
jgi:hypothetical protein